VDPTYHIKLGLLGLKGIKEVTLLEDSLEGASDSNVMTFCIEVSIDEYSDNIPSITRWWYIIEKSYPYGNISCYPDATIGIKASFPHQFLNSTIEGSKCRRGKLCLIEPLKVFESYDQHDPVGDPEMRLRWYAHRTVLWIKAAIKDELVSDGDLFELPDFGSEFSKHLIAFKESKDTYQIWQERVREWGYVKILQMVNNSNIWLANDFFDARKNLIHKSEFQIPAVKIEVLCFWWIWPSILTIPPWQTPQTWGELRDIAKKQSVSFEDVLKKICNVYRDNEFSILLIGFPIPKIYGERNVEFHFVSVLLPEISSNIAPPKGYRKNQKGFYEHEKRHVFNDNQAISYLKTQNWHPERLLSRGTIVDSLLRSKVLIIGVGALGSIIAELLVRSGLSTIGIIDSDLFEAGNVIRHTLTYQSVGLKKVDALADKLRTLNPYVSVKSFGYSFPDNPDDIERLTDEFDLLIDCTASEIIINLLGQAKFSYPKKYASFSAGCEAEHFYSYLEHSYSFSSDTFSSSFKKWKSIEHSLWSENPSIIEGAGCWSPLCRIRYDDIIMIASIAIKLLELLSKKEDRFSKFEAFQKTTINGICTGYTYAE